MRVISLGLAAVLLSDALGAVASSGADDVRTIIEGRAGWSMRSRAEALSALTALGPAFVPAACELLLTEPDAGAEEEPADADQAAAPLTGWDPETLLYEALAQFPPEAVVQSVDATIRSDSSLTLRLTAARLFASFGAASEIAAVLRLFEQEPETVLARPSVQARVEGALLALLERDPSGWDRLEDLGRRSSVELERVRLACFAQRGDERAAAVLNGALGNGELDGFVLAALAQLEPRAALAARDWIVGAAVPYLAGGDPEARRAALFLVGKHAAVEYAEPLVEALEDSDERVRAAARRALVQLTQVDRPEDPQIWRAFWKRERAWRTERFDLLARQLEDDDVANARDAMSELIAHAAYRRASVTALVPVVLDADAERARIAIGYLAALDEPSAIEPLIRAAQRDDAAGRAALAALPGLARRSFETHADWRAWWESPVSP